MDIIQTVTDDKIFGKYFKDKDSWRNWFILLKAVYGLPMTEQERAFYYTCTHRKKVPDGGFNEFYAIVGRRGGKSYISALIACYEAVYGDWNKYLNPGEIAEIFVIATEKRQARIILDYIKAFMRSFPRLILGDKKESVDLNNGIEICIKTASFRATRGYSTAAVILDELAFFRSETSANPAEEIVTGLIPSLLPGAKLIGISTPYAKWGYLYEMYKDHYENEDSDIMVWTAPTRVMNPTFSLNKIERLKRKDPIAAKTEYNALFREDVHTYLPESIIDRQTDVGIFQRSFDEGNRYFAFTDPSGGRNDSYTFAIGHREGNQVVLDYLNEFEPPFSPKEKTTEICEILRLYGIHEIVGDKYAGIWVSSAFKDNGVRYVTTNMTKNDIYLEFAGIMNLGRTRLLESKHLKHQIMTLERLTHQGGRDVVDHGRGMKDDLANAVAGVIVLIFRKMLREPSLEELESRLPMRRESDGQVKVRSAKEEMDSMMKRYGGRKVTVGSREMAYARRMAKIKARVSARHGVDHTDKDKYEVRE